GLGFSARLLGLELGVGLELGLVRRCLLLGLRGLGFGWRLGLGGGLGFGCRLGLGGGLDRLGLGRRFARFGLGDRLAGLRCRLGGRRLRLAGLGCRLGGLRLGLAGLRLAGLRLGGGFGLCCLRRA